MGLCVNLLYLLILSNIDISYENLQLPEGRYSENRWKNMDVHNYVGLARNFLEFGVLGEGDKPESGQTIGYPLFLVLMIKVFGEDWLFPTYILQAFLFACIYPALTCIIRVLFTENCSQIAPLSFLCYLLSGAYFVTVPVLLTGLFFTVIFTIGVCFGLLASVRGSWGWLLLQLIFIGYAAQSRNLLSTYAFVNALVLLTAAKKHNCVGRRRVRTVILVSSLSLLVLGNGPAIRNYLNYKIFAPSLSDLIAFEAIAKWVMEDEGELEQHERMREEINSQHSLRAKFELRNRYVLEILTTHPVATLKRMLFHTTRNMGNSHIVHIFPFFGYWWRDVQINLQAHVKQSYLALAVEVLAQFYYLVLYFFLFKFLWVLAKKREFLCLATAVLFLCAFIIPTLIGPGGARFRLPVEGFMTFISVSEMVKTAIGRRLVRLLSSSHPSMSDVDHR